jgi:hypothetical protein
MIIQNPYPYTIREQMEKLNVFTGYF